MFTNVLLVLSCVALATAQYTYTGNVVNDFPPNELTKRVNDNAVQDVGLPQAVVSAGFTTSGYDIEYIVLRQNSDEDSLDIGIKCFVICGDAEGDGNPDSTSASLAGLGGVDQPFWALSESALVAFDFDNNGGLDFIIGYPASQSVQSAPFPCGTELFDVTCFGLYRYYSPFSYSQAQYRFNWVVNDPALGASPTTHARDNNPQTSAARPHIEWTILNFNSLLSAAGMPTVDYSGVRPWALNILAFQGSFEDDGVGEDFLPGSSQVIPIEFPCRTFDACGVCGGDNSTCADCLGNPNGNAVYDLCDVCNGNSNTCRDCANIINGPTVYDVCDVCGGNGQSCLDCAGVPNGPNVYDVCDVCGGNGQSCLDCAGTPNGPAVYDHCNVCNGNGLNCLDCTNVPFGTNTYDVCDICAGNGDSCLDCAGVPNGPNVYDVCDVCGGNGQSCLDCAGTPNGPAVYDHCNVCNGNGLSCLDCANVPFGTNTYDVCDICAGNGDTCLDCAGVPNGAGDYDVCGVCNGDGKSCRCDGALLTQSCDHPLTLVRSTCVEYQGQTLSQEVWLDPWDGAREVHYFVAFTETYFGDESSVDVNALSTCPCTC